MADTTRIFNEILKISSRIPDETDVVKLSKISSALNVLSSAMVLVSIDENKAKRLVTLANSISSK